MWLSTRQTSCHVGSALGWSPWRCTDDCKVHLIALGSCRAPKSGSGTGCRTSSSAGCGGRHRLAGLLSKLPKQSWIIIWEGNIASQILASSACGVSGSQVVGRFGVSEGRMSSAGTLSALVASHCSFFSGRGSNI